MAGRGPAPKPAHERARTNRNDPTRVLVAEAAAQPRLPKLMPDGARWPSRTRRWWRTWGSSPLSDQFTGVEWEELLVCAVLHGRFWSGDVDAARELRLRVGKFGATPEDRLRLRVELDVDTGRDAQPEVRGGDQVPAWRRDLRLVDEEGA